MALSDKPKYLLGRERGHAFQILTIDPIFFKNLAVASQVYLFQPPTNILKSKKRDGRAAEESPLKYVAFF